MRILHVLEALEGGVALHVRTLAEGQIARGHEVTVAAPERRVWGATDETTVERLRSDGATVVRLPMHRVGPHPRNAAATVRVGRLIRNVKPAVVHTHSAAAGVIARPVARTLGCAVVHTPNGVPFADVERTRDATLARIAERAMAPFTSTVIATSPTEAAVLARAYPSRKVATIANGVAVGPPPPPLPERPRIVAVNRFVYQKHPQQLVRVLAALHRRHPEVEAVLVGYGELEPEVRALIAELDPSIQIAQQPGAEAIAGASVLLLASRWEGAPYVLLEAMNLGRPVVASDVVGSHDTVVEGVTGMLFPWNDPEAGADRLATVLAEPARLAAMGAAARKRLEDVYGIDTMIDAVQRIYESATR